MERKVKIYVLKNPVTNEIHYVGRSLNPFGRYRVHIYLAKKANKKNKKDAWICSLLINNLKPKMEIVDEIEEKNAIEKEREWIEKLFQTCDLKNCRDYLANNYLFSKESREKMSNSAKGNTNRRGKKTPQEAIDRIAKSKIGKKHSEEQLRKKSKIIIQYDKQGNFIKEWPSGAEAARQLHLRQGLISLAANNIGFRKSHGGFIWKYKNE